MRSNGCASKALNGPKGVNKAELCDPHLLDCIPRGIPPQLGQRLDCDQARTSLTGKYRQSLNRSHQPTTRLGCTRLVVILPDVRDSQAEYRAATKVRPNAPRWQTPDGGGVRRGPCHTDRAADKRGNVSSLSGGTTCATLVPYVRAYDAEALDCVILGAGFLRDNLSSSDPPRVCSSIIYQTPAYIPATPHSTQVPLRLVDPSPQSSHWADALTCVYEPFALLDTPGYT